MSSDNHLIPRKWLWLFVVAGFVVSILWGRHDLNQETYEQRVKDSQFMQSVREGRR